MQPSLHSLREQLRFVLDDKTAQGHQTAGLYNQLAALPDSYDDLAHFAERLPDLPLREDWPYVEPNDLDDIWAECHPDRLRWKASAGIVGQNTPKETARRAEAAFLGSVCGCILGKPLEIRPTLAEIRTALESIGEWPMNDYISEHVAPALSRPLHNSWPRTVRERIAYVAADDDINYTIMGALVLEQHGLGFTQEQLRDLWLHHLPIGITFGPERTMLVRAGLNTLSGGDRSALTEWVTVLNPQDEKCGALIRADAYGYACPGRPALAAELAWRDASWTHRRTGIYGAMFVAATIALAPVMTDRMAIFETALQFVPQRSRFHAIAADSLHEVRQASDWLDGYYRIHGKYGQYGHCLIYQEVGTLMNTLRFAKDVGDGICKQVSQGNDTDSFGATVGSILGAYFGPEGLDKRWLAPFDDDLRTGLARFYERSLTKVAKRMGKLPKRIAADTGAQTP